MPYFSDSSNRKLDTCHPALQRLFRQIVKTYDCTILCGTRNRQDQNKAYKEGRSKLKFPQSKHNGMPSKAVDVGPYINGDVSYDDRQCTCFGGYVMGVASQMGIPLRWGGDWDSDKNLGDQTFNDLLHFELRE